jgi:hypothetical protein
MLTKTDCASGLLESNTDAQKHVHVVQDDICDSELTPKQVVDRLDRYIVGQVRIRDFCEETPKPPLKHMFAQQVFWRACAGGCETGCCKCFAK